MGPGAGVAVAVAPGPISDSAPVVPPAAAPHSRAAERPTPSGTSPASASTRELAIAGGSIGELSDGELSALVDGIESLDGVPSADVETPAPVSMSAQEGI